MGSFFCLHSKVVKSDKDLLWSGPVSIGGYLQVYTFGVRDGKEERETCPKSAHNRLTGISAPVDATHKSAPG